MKYFDAPLVRRGTDCVKWDEAENDVLPLWVADMDFETAPCVKDAVLRRAAHGAYGYNVVPESFYEAVIRWQGVRHGWTPQRAWIQYTSGVVPAVSAIIKALCRRGDGVLTFTPAYNCFFSSVRNNGCRLVDFPLTWHPAEESHSIDFRCLERVISEQRPSLLLLCNPHNPTGRVWTGEELRRVAALCGRYDVSVLSDEIHCEFINPFLGRGFVPFATVAEDCGCRWLMTSAANKAFNIAGLQMAYIISPDEDFRTRIDRAINDNEVCDVNCFSFVATQAAYSAEGAGWLDALNAYIFSNYDFLRTQMKSVLPDVRIARLEGTYLAWVDVRDMTRGTRYEGNTAGLADDLHHRYRVWINAGEMYGREGFLRINLATQRSRLEEALRRIVAGLTALTREGK